MEITGWKSNVLANSIFMRFWTNSCNYVYYALDWNSCIINYKVVSEFLTKSELKNFGV